MGEPKNLCVVVGAGGILGRAIVSSLARRGLTVVAAGRHCAKLRAAYSTLPPKIRNRVHPMTVDVTDVSAVREFFDSIESKFGIPSALITAMGVYGAIGDVGVVAPEIWRRAIEVNTYGAYNCCHFLVPRLIRQGRGSIVNIAGGGASGPLEHLSSYAVSKVAIARLSDTLANELSMHGIFVNAVLPGPVDSPMQDELLAAGDRAGHWHTKIKELREKGVGGTAPNRTVALIDFLLFGKGRRLNGKLLSARHDPFDDWNEEQIAEIANSPMYSLRRIDPSTLGLLSGA